MIFLNKYFKNAFKLLSTFNVDFVIIESKTKLLSTGCQKKKENCNFTTKNLICLKKKKKVG